VSYVMPGLSAEVFQKKLASVADGLVVALAVALPWSTSATAILAVLWILVLLPTLRLADIRRELMTPAGALPVILVALGVVGMLWADATALERWKGLDSFLKLLAIPLLFVQFRRSDRGECVFLGYLMSCVVLLAATVIVIVTPWAPALINYNAGSVLVKNAPTQAGEFVTCIFGLLFLAHEAATRKDRVWVFGCSAIIFAMLADITYLSASRTALVVAVVLLVVFGIKRLTVKGMMVAFGFAVLIGVIGWTSSPYLRGRTEAVQTELQKYEATNERTSSGERVEFWTKSIEFVGQALVLGHGTGSIHALFEKSAAGKTGTAGVASTNPHNQTLAVAIQLGLVGVVVLWAMWMAHLRLFLRANSLAEWIGLVVVVQNIVGSLFNSHLFDFVQGWVYVVGVGVAGGIVLKTGSKPPV